MTEAYPRIILKEFRLSGEQDTNITFSEGLNILHGHNQAYRTVLFRLIRYAMGGTAKRISDEIMKKSEIISLSMSVNGEIIQADRPSERPSGRFKVTDSKQEYSFNMRDMSKCLNEKLGMPQVYLQRTIRGKTIDVPLSFNDLARVFVVDRDVSYSSILSEMPPGTIIETVKIFLGLTTKEIAETENNLRTLRVQQEKLSQQIEAINAFLKELDVPTLIEIEGRQQNLKSLLNEIIHQEEEIRRQVQNNVSDSIIDSDDYAYTRLRQELVDKRRDYEELDRERLNIAYQLNDKRELLQILKSEARKINRHLAAKHVVSSFTFIQCPRCMQIIDDEMKSREINNNCMVCGRKFNSEAFEEKTWGKALKDVKQLIKEAEELIDSYETRLLEIDPEIKEIQKRVEWLEGELTRETHNYISPIIENMSLRSAERISIERGLSKLDYQQRQREYAIHLRDERLPKAEKKLEEISQVLEKLQHERISESKTQNAFINHFRYFLEGVELGQPFTNITWDKKKQLPLIDGQQHKKVFSGPNLALAVLAFHYALLAMSVETPFIKTNHPKLLMIDEPEQQKMGKSRYQKVMMLFGDLAIKHVNSIQIIIMTATGDILPEHLEYSQEI